MTASLNSKLISYVRGALAPGSGGRSAAIVVTGTAVSQLISIAAAPVLTRLYGPDSYGIYGVWMALIAPVAPLLTLQYELAIVPASNDGDALALTRLTVRMSVISGLVAFLGFLAWTAWSGDSFGLGATLPMLPLAAGSVAIMSSAGFLSNRYGDYALIARAKVTAAAIGAGSQVLGGVIGPGPFALAFGRSLGLMGGALMNSRSLFNRRRSPSAPLRDVAGRYRKFPLRLAPAHVIGTVAQALPVLIIGVAGGPAYAGYYTLGTQVFGVPSSLIAGSLGDVFRERAARSYRETGSFRGTTRRTLAVAIPGGAAVAIGGVALSPVLTVPIFGPDWQNAVPILQLMAVNAGLSIALTPVDKGVIIVGRLGFSLAWQVARLSLVLLVWAASVLADLEPLPVIALLLAVNATLYTVDVILVWRWSQASPAKTTATTESG